MNLVDNHNALEKYFFRASAESFKEVPNKTVAYWISTDMLNIFKNSVSLSKVSDIGKGLDTGDNNRFLRYWFETSLVSNKWVPCQKGGPFRKWYGNNEFVINWAENGKELKSFPGSNLRNSHNYFKAGLTWTRVSSSSTSFRWFPGGHIFESTGPCIFSSEFCIFSLASFLNSNVTLSILKFIAPTLDFQSGHISSLPIITKIFQNSVLANNANECITNSQSDWDSYETSWDFTTLPLLHSDYGYKLSGSYAQLRAHWQENTLEMQRLEEENNRIFIEAYGLQDELTPEVPLNEITLTCNPHYRYRLGKQWDDASEEERNAELEPQLQSDTICELISYIIGCMMGRYSIDQPGLILASQGETLKDYLQRVSNPRFMPDDDAIVPLTDQEWFEDDATHRVREFVRTVWGEQHLQENLDFIAESLCLSAMRPRKGESSLDCIRRYLSTQFYKDHMRTYKKRPIYWLFSSGKLKAFECLVYLHRYNEGTLARMRTEYVIPLTAKLHSYTERLENEKANSTSTADTRRLEKEIDQLHKQQAELAAFDEQLRDYADQRIQLDLDDGVKVNYGKFGNLLADVKAIVG